MEKPQKRLGEILIEKGLINAEQLDEALEEQKASKEFLGMILLKSGRIKEKDLLTALSEQFGIPLVSLKNKYIDWGFVQDFSPSLIMDYRCFPVKKDGWCVTFAITNPLDSRVLQKAEEEARGTKVKYVLVLEEDMSEVIERYREYKRTSINKLFE
jgi:type IV pilus assembly protein PilB